MLDVVLSPGEAARQIAEACRVARLRQKLFAEAGSSHFSEKPRTTRGSSRQATVWKLPAECRRRGETKESRREAFEERKAQPLRHRIELAMAANHRDFCTGAGVFELEFGHDSDAVLVVTDEDLVGDWRSKPRHSGTCAIQLAAQQLPPDQLTRLVAIYAETEVDSVPPYIHSQCCELSLGLA